MRASDVGGENESGGWGSGEVGGDSSEAGLVTTKKGKKNQTPVSVLSLPRTSEINRREMCL